jgi:hypothetical protein
MNSKKATDIFNEEIIEDIKVNEKDNEPEAMIWFLEIGLYFKKICQTKEPITSIKDNRINKLKEILKGNFK